MNRLLPLLIVGFTIHCAWAQQEPAEFGNVSMKELQMKTCALDSSASAVILFDEGQIDPKPNGANLRKHVRIKLFNKQAYDEWGSVSLVVERSTFSKLKGATYSLENGVIIKSELRKEGIFKSRIGKQFEEIKFTFPHLTAGSVIEYSYTIGIDEGNMPSWSFQTSIPTLWSGYTVKSFGWNYKTDIRGTLPLTDYQAKNDDQYHRWVIANSPAFKTEPLMPHPGIYKSTINFWWNYNNWSIINRNLLLREDFGEIIIKNTFLKKKADELTSGIHDIRQKIKLISDYVKQNITWDGTLDFYAYNPKLVLERKTGTSGDVNIFLGSLLANADLKVNMVLLSTRNHGLVLEQYPSVRQFNYVVCRVSIDSTTLLLDATEKSLPYDVLPKRCLNYDGLSIEDSGPEWIRVNSKTKAKISVNADLSINESGELQGKLAFLRDGYEALDARRAYEASGKDAYLKDFLTNKSWLIEKSEIQNMEHPGEPVIETYEALISNETTQAGNMMYINPFVALREETNPFIAERREYPIDFGIPKERIFVCSFTMPEGYMVEELPLSKVIKMEDNSAKCTFNISQTGNRLFVMNNLQINKTIFMKEEYPALREFYTRLVAKMAEQIVLKKKK